MKRTRGFTIVFLLSLSAAAAGQTPIPTPAGVASTETRIKRWFEFDQLSLLNRYHFIENDNNTKPSNNDQYQFAAKFRVKFDPKGKYSVAANLATGPVFGTVWNSTGWGTGSTQRNLNFRQLYLDAKPTKAVEVQIGGLYINYGENTEALTYDNDGYITGERVRVFLPKKLYFDEVSLTFARLADPNTPNVFNRFRRFDRQNYHQFLVRKKVNKFVSFSGDYTFESGRDTFHEAVKITLPANNLIDTVLFENYQRFDPDTSYGFNTYAEKKLNKIFTLGGGFANVHIPALNGDRFPPGKRVYFNGIAKLSRELTLTTQFTQGVGYIAPNIARTRLDLILNYNILETLRRTRFF